MSYPDLPADAVPVHSKDGTLFWTERSAYEETIASGGRTFELEIYPDTAGWLTVSEAAAQMADDFPGLDPGKAATRISAAIASDQIRSKGKGKGARRIDPESFFAWLYWRLKKDAQKEATG